MLIIFDKDGTLIGERGRVPEWGDPAILRPGVEEALDFYRNQGHVFAVASNQGGVAFGHLTAAQAATMVLAAAELIGAAASRYCPFHPRGTIPAYTRDAMCRKPRPGMLLEIMGELDFDADDTLMVGDMEDDMKAAQAAGVEFRWAQEFFDPWT